MPTAEIVTDDPDTATTRRFPGQLAAQLTARLTDWHRAVVVGLIAYAVTRLCVFAGAGVRASQMAVDARKLAELAGVPAEEPTAVHTITEVLTSWDGRWYLELIRRGYPDSIPANITYEQLEARAAFFPVYPMIARGADWLLPGGDTLAAILVNLVLGAVAVVLVGLLGPRAVRRHRRDTGDGAVHRVPRQLRAHVHVLRSDADRARRSLSALPRARAMVARRHRRR